LPDVVLPKYEVAMAQISGWFNQTSEVFKEHLAGEEWSESRPFLSVVPI